MSRPPALLAALGIAAIVLSACSSNASAKPVAGGTAAEKDRDYVAAALQALGLSTVTPHAASYTGNNYCGGPNDDQGEIAVRADLGMLSASDADRLFTQARDYWKAQGYKIEKFELRAPTEVDNSHTPPAPSSHHFSSVNVDAHGYQLSLGWTDDPLPNATANASLISSSPCATKLPGSS